MRMTLVAIVLLLFQPDLARALPEVWVGVSGNSSGPIRRYDLGGNFVSSFTVGQDVGSLALVGSEVWVGVSGNSSGPIRRYDFDGNFVNGFNVGQGVGALVLVPEPATLVLVSLGLLAVAYVKRTRCWLTSR